jgi:hypothetical protein
MSVAQLKEVNGIRARSNVGAEHGGGADRRLHARIEKMPIMYAPPIPVSVRRVFPHGQGGETLPAIAKRYKVSTDDIGALESARHQGHPGQKLMLEVRVPPARRRRRKSRQEVQDRELVHRRPPPTAVSCVLVLRTPQHRVGRAALDDPALVHHRHFVREVLDDAMLWVMKR